MYIVLKECFLFPVSFPSFRSDALANYSFKREFSTSEIEYKQILHFVQI